MKFHILKSFGSQVHSIPPAKLKYYPSLKVLGKLLVYSIALCFKKNQIRPKMKDCCHIQAEIFLALIVFKIIFAIYYGERHFHSASSFTQTPFCKPVDVLSIFSWHQFRNSIFLVLPDQTFRARTRHANSPESNYQHLLRISNVKRNSHSNNFQPRIVTFLVLL